MDNVILQKQVRIQIMPIQDRYISRSEARELLLDLDEFGTVIFDFDQVQTVGQAFADEVFRVFQQKYPQIKIEAENMSEGVRFMIERAKKR